MDERTWLERYEHASWKERLLLLGGGAVRVTAHALESALDRAARNLAAAEVAFRKELDPNISDARILEERPEVRPRRPAPPSPPASDPPASDPPA